MAYDTLIREAKDLPEDMIEQVIEFMRFLKYASKKEQTNHSINNSITFHRPFQKTWYLLQKTKQYRCIMLRFCGKERL